MDDRQARIQRVVRAEKEGKGGKDDKTTRNGREGREGTEGREVGRGVSFGGVMGPTGQGAEQSGEGDGDVSDYESDEDGGEDEGEGMSRGSSLTLTKSQSQSQAQRPSEEYKSSFQLAAEKAKILMQGSGQTRQRSVAKPFVRYLTSVATTLPTFSTQHLISSSPYHTLTLTHSPTHPQRKWTSRSRSSRSSSGVLTVWWCAGTSDCCSPRRRIWCSTGPKW